jgi:hypothetical protein
VVNEILELVTWADIRPGDRVWSMGEVCTIEGEPFLADGDEFRPGLMRLRHVPDKSSRLAGRAPIAPPVEMHGLVARILPSATDVTVNYFTEARKAGAPEWAMMGFGGGDEEAGREVYESFLASKRAKGFTHSLRLVRRTAEITDVVLESDE